MSALTTMMGRHTGLPLLPYHGLGSGIKRALEKWPSIDFTDDHDGCLLVPCIKPVRNRQANCFRAMVSRLAETIDAQT